VSELSGEYGSGKRAGRSGAPPDLESVATDVLRMFRPLSTATPLPARDLTFGQLRLLFLLHREGAQPMGRIATLFDLTSTGASGLVERVERHGLVERHHGADDRRVVECDLTHEGRRLVQQFAGVRLAELKRTLSVLEPDELAQLQRLVRVVSDRQTRA
jgi:DNA-binding MarR family transcriptional regulator